MFASEPAGGRSRALEYTNGTLDIIYVVVIDRFPNTDKFGSVCHKRFTPETIMRA